MRNKIDLEKLKELFETGQEFTREELAKEFGVGVTALSPAFSVLESRYPIVIHKRREPNERKFKFYRKDTESKKTV